MVVTRILMLTGIGLWTGVISAADVAGDSPAIDVEQRPPIDMTEFLQHDSPWILSAALPVESDPEAATAEEEQPLRGPQARALANLLKPVQDIQVHGVHRSEQDESAKHRPPENQAARIPTEAIPQYYTTTGYGVTKAPRNTLGLRHNPLYYEDPNLERCGQSHGCLTSACSALRFASQIALTPYQMGANPPDTCVRALPDCPTCHRFDCKDTWPKCSCRGFAAQGLAVTGLIFVIP